MVRVLDQYEVEGKESYISGTYDRVIGGTLVLVKEDNGTKKLERADGITFDRGVIFGETLNYANTTTSPGTTVFDFSTSVSYRAQPYSERAGNCKAVKYNCSEERIYDTLPPDPIECFKINSGNIFYMYPSDDEAPGGGPTYGIQNRDVGFIIFDNYIPPENTPGVNRPVNLNPGVDKHWTKSYPFEPRYSSIKRRRQLSFHNIEASHIASFYSQTFTKLSINKSVRGLIVGTVGRVNVDRSNKPVVDINSVSPNSSNWYHHWSTDARLSLAGASLTVTGSSSTEDLVKTIYGFGDANTTFFDSTIVDSSSRTGFARRGTQNWPAFRIKKTTTLSPAGAPVGNYEGVRTSYWNIGPIIRGWKYGLYSGLPQYTNMYFRRGKFGQFRDMLEQRIFVNTVNEKKSATTILNNPVTVKFVDAEGNLTRPENTQSQNLSEYATSSLPYFDMQSRNRNQNGYLANLSLITLTLDESGNLTV